MPKLTFGDYVNFYIPGHGCDPDSAYVVGEMAYSENGKTVLIAGEKWDGMPIHEMHCSVGSKGHDEIAQRLRDRYEEKYPGCLKPHAVT